MIIIQTTVDEQKKAQNLINLLLETNKIESLMREVVDVVKQNHPYELPKITVLEPVFTLPEYENWVSESTT